MYGLLESRNLLTANAKKLTASLLAFLFVITPLQNVFAQENSVSDQSSATTSDVPASSPEPEDVTNTIDTSFLDEALQNITNTQETNTPENTPEADPETETPPPEDEDPPPDTPPEPDSSSSVATNKWLNSNSENVRQPEANHISGAFTYDYPIVVPPGRKGVEPHLTLSYNSQDKRNNSIFGYGWSLNIPYIERVNKRGLNHMYSDYDFSSSFDGELATTTSDTDFAAKFDDGSFRKYTLSISTTSQQWTMIDKTGTQYIFGSSATAKIFNPATTTDISRWMLESVQDTNGNLMTYEYTKDTGQIYPYKIKYTANATSSELYVIEFLTEARSDALTSYETGSPIKTSSRISEIDVKISGGLTRKYVLAYTTGNNTVRSLLQSITETGYTELSEVASTLPSTTFNYQGMDAMWPITEPSPFNLPYLVNATGTDLGFRVLPYLKAQPSTLIHMSSTSQAGYNASNWTSATIATGTPMLVDADNKDLGTGIVDFNGDGMLDFIIGVYSPGVHNAYVWTPNGYVSSTSVMTNIPDLINTNIDDIGIRFGDFNGDSYTDYIRAPNTEPYVNTFSTFLNMAEGTGWSDSVLGTSTERFTDGNANDNGVRIMDVNGDGLDDMIHRRDGDTVGTVYVNRGWGVEWDIYASSTIPQITGTLGKDIGTRVADINGDGLTDFIVSTPSRGTRFYLNKGDNSFYDLPTTTEAIPYFLLAGDTYDKGTRIIDGNDDGLPDFVISSNATQYNHLSVGHPVDVLTSITLPTGGSYSVTYKGNRVDTNLLQVVDTITATPALGGTPVVESYIFSNGAYQVSYQNRKFQGFGIVKRSDSNGNFSKAFYHQGNGNVDSSYSFGEYNDTESKMYYPYRVDNIENLTGGNATGTTAIYRWDEKDLGNGRKFPYLRDEINLEFNGDSTHRDSATSYDYSTTTGNLIEKIERGEVTAEVTNSIATGNFSDILSDKRTTTYTYATSSTSNLIGLPSEVILKDNSGTTISDTRNYYDNFALGTASKGNVTKQEWMKTAGNFASTTKTYNSFGLPTRDKDARGNNTDYIYDTLNLFVATSTNPLGHVTGFQYDYSSGKKKSTYDANGRLFQILYDGLDRVIEEKTPDQTTPSTLVTKTQYTYDDTSGAVSVRKRVNLDGSTTNDSYSFYDGLGRTIQTRSQAESANTYATKDFVFDERGLLQKESLPYFSTGTTRTTAVATGSPLYVNYSYDPLRRVNSVTNAVSTTTTVYEDWKVVVTDSLGKLKETTRDAFNNLATVIEHNGASSYTTTYTWDTNNNLSGITDASGNVRNFTYDGIGRRLTAQDLHASGDATYGTWTYSYDDAGNINQAIDPKSQTVNFTYDSLNRKLTEDYTGQAGTEITNVYDTGTDGKGRLVSASTTASLYTYTYNPLGLLKTEAAKINGTSTTFTTQYEYDRQGNQTTITYPDNSRVSYTYNSGVFLETVQKKEAADPSYSYIVSNFDYAPTGQASTIQYANGVTTTNTYNSNQAYRLTNKVSTLPNASHAQDMSYTYDALGNITQISDVSSSLTAKIVNYSYDDLSRLLIASTTGATSAPNYRQVFTYDALGSITSGPLGTYTYAGNTGGSYANPHAVTSIATTTGSGAVSTSTPTLITSIAAGGTPNTVTTASVDTTGANFIIISVAYDMNATPTISDSKSNTWTPLTVSSVTGSMANRLYYSQNPTVGSGHTFSNTGANNYSSVCVVAFSGVSGSSFDKENGATSTASTIQPGSVTPSVDNELLITGLGWNSTRTTYPPTLNSSFTVATSSNFLSSNHYGCSIGYFVQTPAAAINPTWSLGSAGSEASRIATFRPATTTGGSTLTTTLAYDNNGNLTSSATSTYTWDYRNQMTQSGNGVATSSYAYDHSSNRVKLTEGSMTTFFPNKLYSAAGSGSNATTTRHIFGNGLLLASVESTTASSSPIIISTSTPAFDATSTAFNVGVDNGPVTKTWTHTVTGSNPVIVLSASIFQDVGGTGSITSATWNGGAFTFASSTRTGTKSTEMWYLVATTTGAKTMSVTVTGKTDDIKLAASSFTGISPTSPLDVKASSNGSSGNPSVSLTTLTQTDTLVTTFTRHTTADATTSQTSLYKDRSSSIVGAASYILGTTTKLYTDTYTGTASQNWSMIMLAFRPATTSSGGGSGATTTTRYVLTDHLGGSGIITDGGGSIVETMDYYPYGAPKVDTKVGTYAGENRKYIGERYDAQGQLSYLNARYYDNVRGQFVGQDPVFWEIGLTEEGKSVISNPQLQNSYSYGRGNPIVNRDPTGRCAWDACVIELSVTSPVWVPYVIAGGTLVVGWLIAAQKFTESVQPYDSVYREAMLRRNSVNWGNGDGDNKGVPEWLKTAGKVIGGLTIAIKLYQTYNGIEDEEVESGEVYPRSASGVDRNINRLIHGPLDQNARNIFNPVVTLQSRRQSVQDYNSGAGNSSPQSRLWVTPSGAVVTWGGELISGPVGAPK